MENTFFTRSIVARKFHYDSLLVTLLLLFLSLTLTTYASDPLPSSADWTVGLGGNPPRNGLSSEIGPTTPDILWQGGVDSWAWFQPFIEGDVVVMTRAQSGSSLIVAHNLTTGAILWTADLPMDFPTESINRVVGIRDGRVYASRIDIHGSANYVYALSAADGSILWRSEGLIEDTTPGQASFAPNGDLVIGNRSTLIRILATDGTTVWEVNKKCLVSSGCSASVFGNKAYVWDTPNYEVTAYDLGTGNLLYQAPPTGLIGWQTLPFVGPDGTVYAPKVSSGPNEGALIAYEDTGTALIEKWRGPFGDQPLASFGVGPDGSVYSYTPDNEIVRLDPVTGAILNTSQELASSLMSATMAIDAAGNLFVVVENSGILYSFNPDLTLRWSVYVPGAGSLALGQNGILIVPGSGENVIAFQTGSLPDTTKPTCQVEHLSSGVIFTIQDSGSGLAEILVIEQRNVTVNIPEFEPATTEPVIVSVTLTPPHLRGLVQLNISDVAGNSIICRQKIKE